MHIIAHQELTASGKPKKGSYMWTSYNKGEVTASGRGFRDTTDAVRAAIQCVTAFISPFRKRLVKAGFIKTPADPLIQKATIAVAAKNHHVPIEFTETKQADGTVRIIWK